MVDPVGDLKKAREELIKQRRLTVSALVEGYKDGHTEPLDLRNASFKEDMAKLVQQLKAEAARTVEASLPRLFAVQRLFSLRRMLQKR
jgi:hypothetical protein